MLAHSEKTAEMNKYLAKKTWTTAGANQQITKS